MTEALIRKLSTIADLSEADRAALGDLKHYMREVPARRDVISEGDKPVRVHLVLEGWVARYKVLRNGVRQITAILLPGDFCDLHVTILDAMDHGMVAITNVKVALIQPEQLVEITSRSATLAQAFWWATLLDEAILRSWLVSVGRRSAEARIAHLICELHVRLSRLGLLTGGNFALPLTQQEIADVVGLTSVHVNRMLRLLRKGGLIEQRPGQMYILDIGALRRLADFDDNYLHTLLGPKPKP